MTIASFIVPIRTPSTANLREHWTERGRRNRRQKDAARLLCPRWDPNRPLLVITLTRIGPRELDTDNLASALKAVRDGIAARLAVDDATPLIRWDYRQEKGEPAVRVEVSEK